MACLGDAGFGTGLMDLGVGYFIDWLGVQLYQFPV